MPTLYAIGEDLIRLNALLEECEGDLARAEEIEPAVTEWFDRLAHDQGEKLDSYVGLLKQLDMEIAAAKSEAEQWVLKARSRERRSEFLRSRLKSYLELTGQPKAQTATGRTLSIVKNGGKPPLELDDPLDPAKVPDHLCRIRREIDRTAIVAVLEAGEELPFARLLPRGTHLRIH